MAKFWDLPKTVREQIYRHALMKEEHITIQEHDKIVGFQRAFKATPRSPPLLRVSPKVDREAAHIYYGENGFEFDSITAVWRFARNTYPRHVRMVRRLTFTWVGDYSGEAFKCIARMKGLQELYIRVDEDQIVHDHKWERYNTPFWIDRRIAPQQQLAALKQPGMSGLLRLSGIPHVQFIKEINYENELTGGPNPGGILETVILPKIIKTNASRVVIS